MELSRPLRIGLVRRRHPVGDLDDAALFRLIAAGSEPAFEALWRRYGAAVVAVCRRILSDPEAAEDAAQETFARAWRFAGTVDARRGEPVAWLMTVARNSARNIARVTLPEPADGPPDGVDPARERKIVDRLWLHGALSRLPEAERGIVELAYLADLSHAQVAARTGLPLGTVKSRLRRALWRLTEMAEGR